MVVGLLSSEMILGHARFGDGPDEKYSSAIAIRKDGEAHEYLSVFLAMSLEPGLVQYRYWGSGFNSSCRASRSLSIMIAAYITAAI